MSETFEMDYRDIEAAIPHRPPFLLIDKVTNIVPGQSAVGIKAVSGGEPYFAGHFPGDPVMPGVLIIESFAQVASCMFVYRLQKLLTVSLTLASLMRQHSQHTHSTPGPDRSQLPRSPARSKDKAAPHSTCNWYHSSDHTPVDTRC